MLTTPPAITVSSDGIVTVIPVAAGSVPATAKKVGGLAYSQSGSLYVVFV